jgi:hypothetical protein
MRTKSTLAAAALLLLIAVPAAAQHPKEHGKKTPPAASAPKVQVIFTTTERTAVVDYFRTHRSELKPLPPGIARNLARGKPLPPGIAKQRVPADLSRRLVIRPGYQPLIVGDVVVLVDPVGTVVDMLSNLLH